MLSPEFDRLGIRPLQAGDAPELYALVKAIPTWRSGCPGRRRKIWPPPNIGYWLAVGARGRGLMTTAVGALLDHAFGELELHRIEIHCAPENRPSRAIPERLGFREEARLRETELVGGRYLDSVVYGMLAAEWGSGTA